MDHNSLDPSQSYLDSYISQYLLKDVDPPDNYGDAARIGQVCRVKSFQKKRLKEFGDDTFGNEYALSLVGVKKQKQGDRDELPHAASLIINNKFRYWIHKISFMIIGLQIIKIQVNLRKYYKKIVQPLTILAKGRLILGCGFCASTRVVYCDNYPIFIHDLSQTHTVAAPTVGPIEYMLEPNVNRCIWDDPQAVNSQTLHPSSSSTQADNGKHGLEILKELPTTSIGERAEFGNHLLIQGEPQVISEDYDQGVGIVPLSSIETDTQGNVANQSKEIVGQPFTNRSFGEQELLGNHLPIQGDSQGTTSIPSDDVALERVMDYTKEFTSNKIFESREALIQCTHEMGRKNGFKIVINRSDSGKGGQKARITFCCERSGKYRSTQKNKEDEKENQLKTINTKKCGCPFTLKGYQLDIDDHWMLKVVSGEHNHPMTKPPGGRSYVGRLSKEETSLVIDMSKKEVRPKDILARLKNEDADNVSTTKHIYNVIHRYKAKEKGESSNNTS